MVIICHLSVACQDYNVAIEKVLIYSCYGIMKTVMEDIFGKRLRALRISKGVTQKELAEKIQIGRSTIAEYESGRKTPTAPVVAKIAKYFNVSTDYLLGLTDDPRPREKEFDVLKFLPKNIEEAISKTPNELRKIGKRLIEIANQLEGKGENKDE